MGSAHPLNAPYQAVATADGWINVGAANQANWLRLVEVIGQPALADDARFGSNAERMANRAVLIETLERVFRKERTAHWMERLNEAGIPAGPILDMAEMHEDPQAVARDMITEVEHPVAGTVRGIGAPVKFHGTPGPRATPAPLLGQHSFEVLQEAGYSVAELEALLAAGVITRP